MALINIYFEQYESALKVKLNDVGISGTLAQEFLSETVLDLSTVIKHSSLEKTIAILLSDDPAQLLSLINIDAMATKLNINSERAVSAVAAISPVVSRILILKCNEIVEATASSAWKPARKAIGTSANRYKNT